MGRGRGTTYRPECLAIIKFPTGPASSKFARFCLTSSTFKSLRKTRKAFWGEKEETHSCWTQADLETCDSTVITLPRHTTEQSASSPSMGTEFPLEFTEQKP